MLKQGRRSKRRREQVVEDEGMDERWQGLPEDILLQKILPLVRCPDLCCFRAVCTKWNRLISEPEFQATVAESNPSYLLTSAAVTKSAKLMTDKWDIFDTSTRGQHYAVKKDFLNRLPVVRAKCSQRYARYSQTMVAADKGFICVLWRRSGEDEMMCVVNPVTKSHREVPCFPRGLKSPRVAMAIASDAESFKLFVVGEETISNDHRSFVFDSRVGEWRAMSDPPSGMLPRLMLKMGKELLTIFYHQEFDNANLNVSFEHKIFAYDAEEDMWVNTEVKVPAPRTKPSVGMEAHDFRICLHPTRLWATPQLVVCSGRLFFTAWYDDAISIWEIDLEHKTCAFVAESSVGDAQALQRWPYRQNAGPEGAVSTGGSLVVNLSKRPRTDIGANAVLALGTDDGRILFSSLTRSCLAFVLSDHSWVGGSLCGKSDLDFDMENCRSAKTTGWFASMMPLTLRPVPNVTVGAQPAEPCAV